MQAAEAAQQCAPSRSGTVDGLRRRGGRRARSTTPRGCSPTCGGTSAAAGSTSTTRRGSGSGRSPTATPNCRSPSRATCARAAARSRCRPAALAGLPAGLHRRPPAGRDGLVTLTTEYTDLMPVRDYATRPPTRGSRWSAPSTTSAWPENDAVLRGAARRARRARAAARLRGLGGLRDRDPHDRLRCCDPGVPGRVWTTASADAAAAGVRASGTATSADEEPDADAVTIADFWYLLSGAEARGLRRRRAAWSARTSRSSGCCRACSR